MNKKAIKEKAIAIQQSIIKDFEQVLREFKDASDIDENEPKDPEDMSHQNEATEMSRNIAIQLNRAKVELETLESVPTEKTETVDFGAVIKTDNGVFFISTPSHLFKDEDVDIISISQEAPIYTVMHGKKAGDSFSYNEKKYLIHSVE